MESMPSKNAHTVRALILLAALVIAPLAAYCAAADAQPPAVGTTAPAFTLQSESGSNVSLSDFAGKWVVLYFYPKDFTSGCTIEAHNFQRDLAKYQALGAVIIGVSVDTADSHKQFCAKEGLNFKLLADTDHVVSEKYGSLMQHESMTLSQRNTFLIDPHGKIVKEFMKVDPRDHSENVLAALERAGRQSEELELRQVWLQWEIGGANRRPDNNRGAEFNRSALFFFVALLLDHHFRCFDHYVHRIALLEFQEFRAAAGNHGLYGGFAYLHGHVSHDVAQSDVLNLSSKPIPRAEWHRSSC